MFARLVALENSPLEALMLVTIVSLIVINVLIAAPVIVALQDMKNYQQIALVAPVLP